MTEAILNEEALELLLQKLDNFVWTDKAKEERDRLRQNFLPTTNSGLKISRRRIISLD